MSVDRMHILITGASGSGTTTLGSALARTLSSRHLDADDFYWLPSSPPFQHKRDHADRLRLACAELQRDHAVVLSGSVVGWGAALEDAFGLVVFLYLPTRLRVERLRRREQEQLGHVDEAFVEWAAQYDQGPPSGRSLAKHTAWLAQRTCPVLRLEGDLSVADRVAKIVETLPRAVSG